MCGIVGYIGSRPAVDVLVRGLRRLEYRGYDSAGVAFFRDSRIEIRKAEGKLENVERLLNGAIEGHADATCGIGHTRWATHGKPTTQNAHPHQTGHVVIVHNGIIENYQELKKEIIGRGGHPKSETDSELFGFLVYEEMEKGLGLVEAVRASFRHVQGACSVVVLSEKEPGLVVGVRNGSPLVAARDPKGGTILASDAQPLLEYTREVIFLEQGDMAVASSGELRIVSLETGKELEREAARLDWSPEKLDKQGFPHYMLKEIHEQPGALVDTLNGLLERASTAPFPLAEQPGARLLDSAREIHLVACGSSWHAAQVGKYWLERWARIPVSVDLASEFRYRAPVLGQGAVVLGISQSGETADTLAVVRQMKALGIRTLGITNVRGSTLSREADAVFYTSAGPEIGVAATKTFTAQLLVLLLLAGYLGLRRGADPQGAIPPLFEQLVRVPHLLADFLGSEAMASAREAAAALAASKGFFFIGRGYSFPVALEGALKLKEIAYIHAEGYAAGELKHGPIAMIDEGMAVVVLAPRDGWRDKTVSNLEEVKARGARILGVGAADDHALASLCDHWVPLPAAVRPLDECLLPFLLTPLLQLFSYEIAIRKGTDVDKPRNLAKSVTVE
ncbi:MAG: glutamine--fructose-6-phosphate transaminase (isomerizing) [Oligoflexia bacterium]|nr:glutamine--fructose-6-phosphate transaminase (isomerizing) [Oligoflexia bacterium]